MREKITKIKAYKGLERKDKKVKKIALLEEHKNFTGETRIVVNCQECLRQWTLVFAKGEYEYVEIENLTCPFRCTDKYNSREKEQEEELEQIGREAKSRLLANYPFNRKLLQQVAFSNN